MTSSHANPWASSASYVSVGGLQRVLKIAQSSSYRDMLYDIERRQDEVGNCSSLVLVRSLKQITKLDEKVNKLQQEMQQRASLQSTADLTDPTSLDQFLLMLEDLCNHLQAILDKKPILIGRLQEAYDDHLTIDAEYHRRQVLTLIEMKKKRLGQYSARSSQLFQRLKTTQSVVECFPSMAKELSLLSSKIDSIVWTNNFSLKESHLSSTISKLSSRVSEIQSFYQALEQSRALMRTRLRKQNENESTVERPIAR